MHKVGQRNFSQANVQAHDRRAVEVKGDGVLTRTHHVAVALGHSPGIGVDRLAKHVPVNRQRAEDATPLAAFVVLERDVPTQNLQEVAKAVGAHLVGRGLDGDDVVHRLAKQRIEHARKLGGIDANGQVQVLHTKADQALVGQGLAEVGPTAATYKQVDVTGTKGCAFVADAFEDCEIFVEAQQALNDVDVTDELRGHVPPGHGLKQGLGPQVEQIVDQAAHHGIDAGVSVGSEGVAHGELEVTLKVDEVPEIEREIRNIDGAGDALQTDGQLHVLERVLHAIDRIAQPGRRGHRDAEVEVHQPRQVDLGDQVSGVRELEGEVKGRGVDLEETEQAQVGLHADADLKRIE